MIPSSGHSLESNLWGCPVKDVHEKGTEALVFFFSGVASDESIHPHRGWTPAVDFTAGRGAADTSCPLWSGVVLGDRAVGVTSCTFGLGWPSGEVFNESTGLLLMHGPFQSVLRL